MPERARRDDAGLDAALFEQAREATSGEVDAATFARERDRLVARVEAQEDRRLPLAPRWPWLVAAASFACVVAVVVFFATPRARLDVAIEGAIDGAAADGYVRAGDRGATARFSDGTEVTFTAGTRGRIGEITGHGAHVNIEQGHSAFNVVHAPKAAWIAGAGPFTITVTGTVFDVDWARDKLEVDLHKGSVIVRGPLAPEGVALHAGQRLVADLARGELTIVEPPAPSAPPPASSASPAPERASPTTRSSTPSSAKSADAPLTKPWRVRVAEGDFKGVLADAEARGIDASVDESALSDLAALADAARYAGRSDLARRALLAERGRFSGSPEARSAAFLLGRMAEASSAGEAVGWYDRYLAESPGGSLVGEALGRKMLAVDRSAREAERHGSSAGHEAARPIAADYLRRFPDGGFAPRAKEIAEGR